MTQDEFLSKLFGLYSTTFNRGNGQAWTDAYKQVLKPHLNIDYEKLYEFVICNYSGTSAPKPAYLLDSVLINSLYENGKRPETEKPVEFPTMIVQKGNNKYDYGLETDDFVQNINFFNKIGMQIIKLKDCKTECMRCDYNHVCMTCKQRA